MMSSSIFTSASCHAKAFYHHAKFFQTAFSSRKTKPFSASAYLSSTLQLHIKHGSICIYIYRPQVPPHMMQAAFSAWITQHAYINKVHFSFLIIQLDVSLSHSSFYWGEYSNPCIHYRSMMWDGQFWLDGEHIGTISS